MKTGIFYATSHSSTEKVAKIIKDKLGDENTDLINLKKHKNPSPDSYDIIIIGGSIHAGKIQKTIKSFYSSNISKLKEKKVGLYLCCMDQEKAEAQFNEAFSEELRNISLSNKTVGGEFILENMNFIEKAITKKIANITESVSKIDYSKIDELISDISSI